MKVKLKNQSGTAIVEFAIVLPLLCLLLLGIIEFSIILFDKAMITNASREGSRAGIVFRADPDTGDYYPLTNAEITAVVNKYLSNYLITFGGPKTATTIITRDGSSPGGELKVNVAFSYNFLVLPNFVSSLVNPINLNAVTSMRFE
jgi:Flp pilus assembly protein TadG